MPKRIKRDLTREHRIAMEIVVDAYDSQEQAMGWYYYLQDQLQLPFTATCIAKRAISPLRVKDEVEERWLGCAVIAVETDRRHGSTDEAGG